MGHVSQRWMRPTLWRDQGENLEDLLLLATAVILVQVNWLDFWKGSVYPVVLAAVLFVTQELRRSISMRRLYEMPGTTGSRLRVLYLVAGHVLLGLLFYPILVLLHVGSFFASLPWFLIFLMATAVSGSIRMEGFLREHPPAGYEGDT
jgi:hypothetical protein